MKKHYSLMMLAMFFAALGFTSCGGDEEDESSPLVGIWDVISVESAIWDWHSNKYTPFTEHPQGEYWVFTNNTVTIHAQGDIANGRAVNYEYNPSTRILSLLSGLVRYTVLELTSASMRLTTAGSAIEISVGNNTHRNTNTYVFKKR